MGRLPLHHVGRPRLTSLAVDAQVVVVEAAAGYGKTTLGAELVDGWRAVGIHVALLGGDVSAMGFVARLRSALARAGFTTAAGDMAAAGDDPVDAVDAAIAAVAGERCALVVDDAHVLRRDGAELLSRMAGQIEPDVRLVVLARRLPDGAGRLRRGEYLQLSAADLALHPDETQRLCRDGFGLDVGAGEVRAIHEATAGWTAAAVLAVARAKRTGENLHLVADATRRSPARTAGAVASLLDDAIAVLTPQQRAALAQVARLPVLDPTAVDVAAGTDGFFDQAVAAGVPFSPSLDGWWQLPGSAMDHLMTLAPADAAVLRRVADDYVHRGELAAAMQSLLVTGDSGRAAALLAEADLGAVDGLDVLEIRSVVESLPADAIEAHPTVLLHLARSFDAAALRHARERTLRRAEEVATRSGDPVLRRAIAAERSFDLLVAGRHAEAERAATAIVATVGSGGEEPLTLARALLALGRAVCWRLLPDGRRDVAALVEADAHLAAAAAIFSRLGMRGAQAGTVPYRAMWIEYSRGDSRAAIQRIDEGLRLVADRPRRWAYLLIFRAELAVELGRFDECEANLSEVRRVADAFDDEQLLAYVYWEQAIAASHRGDAAAALELVRLVEQHQGEWWVAAGTDFLASAADELARVGHTAVAWEYLRRAQADPGDAEPVIAMGEASLLARHGDPVKAEACLLEALTHRVDPREQWRITLLRAYAAFRNGDRRAGALAARAFEEASALGLAHLPLTKERTITEELLGLAVETGQPAALALESAVLPVAVSVLGRFEVTRAGRSIAIPAGQTAQLLKLIAVSGGRVVTERVIDALWPEASPEAGRNRLRTVLNRLRADAGDVLGREGETLVMAPEVHVDLARFEAEARQALALAPGDGLGAAALARGAIARYRGELLPDDPYEDWAQLPRERARRAMLELLDVCADAAATRGDLDDLRRVVEMSIDLAPYDDERYLRAAAALLQEGRKGAALSVVRHARAALAELGIEPPSHLLRLERSIVA
jgi:DNA-binding SARP family transcriptional activator/ATP/maltotriose-dependent transcriptional regulator MalT